MEIFKQILHKIKEYDTIIIHRHMRPDPDALGSQVGLKKLLQVNFPEKQIKVAKEIFSSKSIIIQTMIFMETLLG